MFELAVTGQDRFYLVQGAGGVRKSYHLRCLDRLGREQWSRRLGTPRGITAGPCDTVIVADGGRVACYEGVTGALRWKVLVGRFGADTLQVAPDGTVYAFGVGDHSTQARSPRGASGHLCAIQADTGERLWHHRFVPGLKGVWLEEGGRLYVQQYLGPGLGNRQLELDPASGRGIREVYELVGGPRVEMLPGPRRRGRGFGGASTQTAC